MVKSTEKEFIDTIAIIGGRSSKEVTGFFTSFLMVVLWEYADSLDRGKPTFSFALPYIFTGEWAGDFSLKVDPYLVKVILDGFGETRFKPRHPFGNPPEAFEKICAIGSNSRQANIAVWDGYASYIQKEFFKIAHTATALGAGRIVTKIPLPLFGKLLFTANSPDSIEVDLLCSMFFQEEMRRVGTGQYSQASEHYKTELFDLLIADVGV